MPIYCDKVTLSYMNDMLKSLSVNKPSVKRREWTMVDLKIHKGKKVERISFNH